MEEETKVFLIRIVNSISWVLIWMFTNLLSGIYYEFAFVTGSVKLGNILYYLYFAGSLITLVLLLKKKWNV